MTEAGQSCVYTYMPQQPKTSWSSFEDMGHVFTISQALGLALTSLLSAL